MKGKKILSLMLAVMLVLGALPAGLSFTAAADGGTDGDIEWQVYGSTLTISGGFMPDYYSSMDTPWYGYDINNVILNYVQSIGSYAFSNMTNLSDVIIPGTVKSIGQNAFAMCQGLRSVTIPEGVTTIGGSAFFNCEYLENIALPKSLTTIESGAFTNCHSMESVTLPRSLTMIDSRAFADCNNLATVNYTGSPTDWNKIDIGDGAFDGTPANRIVRYYYGVQGTINAIDDIGENDGSHAYKARVAVAFAAYDRLSAAEQNQVTNADLLTAAKNSLPNHSFGECGVNTAYAWDSLTGELVIGGCGDMKDYDTLKMDFSPWYYNSLSSIVIEPGATSIGSGAFYASFGNPSVSIPEGLTKIGFRAFSFCESLQNIVLPESLTDIERQAFYGCKSLENMTIPDSVKSIGDAAFTGCYSLESITIPDSVKSIGGSAFCDCTSLHTVTIHDSITEIGEAAFANCPKLKTVNFTGSEAQWNAIKKGNYIFDYFDNEAYEYYDRPAEEMPAFNFYYSVAGTINAINDIGTVEHTDACKARIDAARKAYDSLSDYETTQVTNYNVLLAAEAAYARLEAAYKAIRLGAGVLGENNNTENAATVYYGGYAWRVIGYDGAGAASESGTATLLAADIEKTTEFSNTNIYGSSSLEYHVNKIAEAFSAPEEKAVPFRLLVSVIDPSDSDGIAGGSVSARLWPLSLREAVDTNAALRSYYRQWWLRSPGNGNNYVVYVKNDGTVAIGGGSCSTYNAVRPAFWLDLSKVLFASAAENGKTGDGLTAVGSYTGTEWKLTVLDESRSGFTAKCTKIENGVYTVQYSGAATGDNEKISAMIVSADGAVTYYGVLEAAKAGENTLTLDVNGKLQSGDTLYVFNEQVNGDKKTDCASALVDVTEKSITTYDLWVGETEVTENCTSGEGWEYAPATNTLTLNDYEYEGVGQSFSDTWNNSNVTYPAASAICYLGSEPLHLVIEGKNTVVQTGAVDTSVGIFCAGTLEISGTGELNVTAGAARSFSFGIECAETLSITGGKINAFGGSAITSAGISASRFSMENGEVYAVGADGGKQSYGIFYAPDKPDAFCSVSGGKLTCRGGKADATSSGLDSSGSVTFSGGEIDLAGGEANISCGLYVERRHTLITVSASVNRVVCTGNSRAFFTNCDLKNETDAGAWKNTSGTGEIFTIPAHTEAVDAVEFIYYKRIEFPSSVYSVTVTAGAGMAKASGDASQTVDKGGSMNSVVYTANNGYYFPTDYAVEAVNGVSVTRDSFTQITVSGTPTGDAAITLPAATAKTTPDMTVTAPTVTYGQNAVITATLPDDATGSVIFSLVGSKNTYTFTDSSITDGVAQVSQKLNADVYTVTATYSGDGKYDGAEKTITFTVEKAATELAVTTSPDTLVYGDAVQITVTLSGGAVFAGDQIDPGTGEPAKAPGSVTITVDGKEYRTISTDPDDVMIVIRDNTATLEVTGLNAGQHTIDAVFVASDNYAGSSQTATFDIGKTTPQITLTAKSLNDAATAYEITVTKPTDSTQDVEIYADHSGLDVITFTVRNDKFENGSYTFRFPDVIQDLLPNNISGEFRLSAVYDGSSDQNYQDKTVELTITLGCDHVWKEPKWDWSQDVNNPTYTAECSKCTDGRITGTVASTPGDRVEATVEKNAYTPYTASVELSGHTYTGTFDLEEPGTMLEARKAAFEQYKADQKKAAEDKALDGDSDDATDLIDAAKTAIDNVTYDESKPLDQNKQAVDAAANLPQLEENLADQRAADAVERQINNIGDVTYTDESKGKIDDARKAYDDLTDAQKALVDNKDTLEKAEDDYQLLDDKNTFEEYKEELIKAAEEMRKDDDSQESKKLIDDVIDAIEAMEYDESKSLDQNKQAADDTAKLDELTEQLEEHRTVYYAVFKADGKEIASLPYTIDTASIDEPAVPVKDNYTGTWPQYEFKAGGVEINAVYVKNGALIITDNAKEQGADRVLTFMETVTFTTDASALPEGAELHWYVNGEEISAGTSVTVENPKDDYTVQVKAFAKDGTVYTESEVLTVKVDHSLWAKIVAVAKLSFTPVFNAMKKVVPSFFSFLIALIKAVAAAVAAVVKAVI